MKEEEERKLLRRAYAVLILERASLGLTGLSQELVRAGFKTASFRDVEATRNWLAGSTGAPDAAILDFAGADSNEEELIGQLLTLHPHSFVLVLSEQVTGASAIARLKRGVLTIPEPAPVDELVALLASHARALSRPSCENFLNRHVTSYARAKGFSHTQELVLRCHFNGMNDKEIAAERKCTESTIQEHWRRMALKAQTQYKRGVLMDFYAFFDAGTRTRIVPFLEPRH
jgi:DNA-binding NarL/FixJ family response regulator